MLLTEQRLRHMQYLAANLALNYHHQMHQSLWHIQEIPSPPDDVARDDWNVKSAARATKQCQTPRHLHPCRAGKNCAMLYDMRQHVMIATDSGKRAGEQAAAQFPAAARTGLS